MTVDDRCSMAPLFHFPSRGNRTEQYVECIDRCFVASLQPERQQITAGNYAHKLLSQKRHNLWISSMSSRGSRDGFLRSHRKRSRVIWCWSSHHIVAHVPRNPQRRCASLQIVIRVLGRRRVARWTSSLIWSTLSLLEIHRWFYILVGMQFRLVREHKCANAVQTLTMS